jgi:ABC-2 type transport system ATP-binding protein
MRMLTGYLPPDGGSATMLGHSVLDQSLDVRRRLGYLPENNPLPEDIEVTDFLHYVGQLRGLNDENDRVVRVKHVLKMCSLTPVVGKKLGELSKGYKQRVGLAQAIIHDPDVLILDEPTSGLDPNQVQDVRGLIQDLKKQKTVILSTHILSEVQHTCDRVLIISKGKIAADGTPNDLAGSLQNVHRLFVSFRANADEVASALRGLPGVLRLEPQRTDDGAGFMIESDANTDLREPVSNLAAERRWVILGLQQKRLSLEEVFRALTQSATPAPTEVSS